MKNKRHVSEASKVFWKLGGEIGMAPYRSIGLLPHSDCTSDQLPPFLVSSHMGMLSVSDPGCYIWEEWLCTCCSPLPGSLLPEPNYL